jgi:hypothetical protein
MTVNGSGRPPRVNAIATRTSGQITMSGLSTAALPEVNANEVLDNRCYSVS